LAKDYLGFILSWMGDRAMLLAAIAIASLFLLLFRYRSGAKRSATVPAAAGAAASPKKSDEPEPKPKVEVAPQASPKVPTAVSPQVARTPEPPQPRTAASSATKSSIEVAEGDPLVEAVVYLEFGYFDRAAQILRDYVDGPGGSNREVLRKLLDVYSKLNRIDDYAEILERLWTAGEDPSFVQTAMLTGLAADHNNLQLRVLAESQLGLGPDQLSKLLGHDLPAEFLEDAAPAARKASRPAAAASPQRGDMPPRLLSPLVEGGMRLTSSFSAEEKAMLCVFTHPAHEARLHRAEARLHRGAGDLDAAVESLHRAISARPQALVNFADLLRILHDRRQLDEYVGVLWHLYLVLDGAGRALRERFLGMGLALGQHPVLDALGNVAERWQLEAIGRQFGLIPEEKAPPRKLKLVEVTAGPSEGWPDEHASDILNEVNSYLEFGQVDEAIEALEEAVLNDPADARLYPPLLDLYDRMDELERFNELSAKVKRLIHQLPEEVAPMMLSLQQRLRDRKQDARRARG
jgi:tetratricopeptide (TPR) repeat protein